MNGGQLVAGAIPERLVTLDESHTGTAPGPVLSRVGAVETLVAAWSEALSGPFLRDAEAGLTSGAEGPTGTGVSTQRWRNLPR